MKFSSLIAWDDAALRESLPASAGATDDRAQRGARANDTVAPPWLLVLTTLSAVTGDHLAKVARAAAELGVGLRLAYYAGEQPIGLLDPLARLAQRARFVRRQHGIGVEVVAHEVRSRYQLLRLSRAAGLTCLLDANERPRRSRLGPDLLSLLLREGQGPLWVVNASDTASAAAPLCCFARTAPLSRERDLMRWSRVFAHGRAVQLVHVLQTAVSPPDSGDAAELTVFDHVFRQLRLQAFQALDTLSRPLREAGCETTFTVLAGDVEQQLRQHLRATRPAMVLIGHRWRPWSVGAARSRVQGIAEQGADALVVPLPRGAWWSWIARAIGWRG